MKIELKDYIRSNRQHWAILPDDQDHSTPGSFIHPPPNSEHVPSRSAPIYPLATPSIQTAQIVDFSSATVSHVAGNLHNTSPSPRPVTPPLLASNSTPEVNLNIASRSSLVQNEGLLATGTYIITNVKYGNVASLPDANEDTEVVANVWQDDPSEKVYISHITFSSRLITSPSGTLFC
jgi:hypothetical protein